MHALHILHVDTDSAFSTYVSRAGGQRSDTATDTNTATATATVTTVDTAAAALEYLADDDHSIDCLVTEYDLPESDGLELLERVRETHPDIPFILFTGEGTEQVVSEAISAGATDYLEKTGGTEQYELLLSRIEKFVDRHRSSQERDRVYQALASATEGIGLLGSDGRYIYVNDAYAAVYGYEPEDLIGTHWKQLYPADEVERFTDDILPSLHRTGEWSGRSRGKRVTGETFPEKLSLTSLENGGHVCVVRDVSDQLAREQQFDTLADNLQGVVYRCGYDPDWPMQHVLGNVEEFLGYTAHSLETQRLLWRDVIHPEDREMVWETVQEAVSNDEPYNITYRVTTRCGETKWVIERGRGVPRVDGSVTTLEGLITDITARKERKQELEWKTKAMDEASMGIVIADPTEADTPITYVNKEFCELTGYDREDVLGRNCRFLQGPLTAESTVETVREGIANAEPVDVDILNYRRDGTPFWNNLQITPVFDDDGSVSYFVGFQTDVTARIEYERRIAVLHRILRHNIRNHLNVQLAQLEELLDSESNEEAAIENVRAPALSLLESSEKARRIESVLSSASFDPDTVPISSLLDRAYSSASLPEGEESVHVSREDGADPTVLAPPEVAVAFRELIENAVHHATDASPTVSITVETKTTTVASDGRTTAVVVVRIEDTNPHIAEMDRTRLLGNDESPVHHGSGLGLWLVNWLVTMSGGMIEHEAMDGGGNRISVALLRPEPQRS
ncbi:HTR-like protein [Natrialba hulunbeirensis JCM 10989]|uniref:HTR-like protein n=1 Tax=Natrialba hulunbeirensis JCM 10989 TaxID=1227493 RepID=M0AA97_9EURY|nr:PAS domain S-box protein [Natrialba hulunbeirensis]ELY95680.1 HTR-like protein [Natrialba hulunbeirensis JCM 10989]